MAQPQNIAETKQKILTKVTPSLPTAQHEQSRLMSLPAEIRNKILEEVLVTKNGVLGRRKWFRVSKDPPSESDTDRETRSRKRQRLSIEKTAAKTKSVQSGYGLVPAVLRTCQQLCVEGLPILYNKNMLILELPLKYPDLLPKLFGEPLRHVDDALPIAVSKFREVKTIIDLNNAATYDRVASAVMRSIETLYPVMLGASLHVCVIAAAGASNERILEIVQHFKLLRCSRFDITGIDHRVAQEIKRIVTGNTDFRKQLSRLKNDIGHRREVDHPESLTGNYRDLGIAARDANVYRFQQIGREMVSFYQRKLASLQDMLNDSQGFVMQTMQD